MVRSLSRASVLVLLVATATFWSLPLQAQTRPAGQGQKPAPQRPAAPTAKPPAPTAKPPAPSPATVKPAEPAPPPTPAVQDLRMKTVYTAAAQKTESVTYRKGQRERFEFGDIIVLRQPDLKRTVQIMRAANTYMIVADGAQLAPPMPAATPAAPPQTPGVVAMTTTITDTGERKAMFGQQARHVKTVMDKQPVASACDSTKQHIETDGWYIDLPPQIQPAQAQPPQGVPQSTGCVDEIKATVNGDPKVLGFPVNYSTTIVGDDGKPNVVAMEITELEITTLDPALFEIPPGLNESGNLQALTKAVSDANETKLTQELRAPSAPIQKIAGIPLVGVSDVVNKTAQQVDTRALRGRLVSELAEMKLNAAPLPAAQGDVVQLAGAQGFDYVLVAEITDLKVSKGGGIGGLLKAASKVAGGGSAEEPTEAAVTIRLVQPDGKARYTTTAKGKDGGFDMKTGLGVARFAGTMYMNMMTGRMMMNALNQSMTGNLGGVGMLGNPSLMNMQMQGLGMRAGMQGGLGIDSTAGAASFLLQQSLASNAVTSGLASQGPSFDAALGDALKSAAKAVSDNLKRAR
ncbi:MAG TPA: hypothetical protein VFD64_03285 [Gemmatimonadaceae bacterium]|nr:hypothetical protein [Gemmatimonadaceae bacterium]